MNQLDPTNGKHYFFAGGGTGGHIYPALAVAEQITRKADGSSVLFFCSSRDIDARILSQSGYEFLPLPAVGLSLYPVRLMQFCLQLLKSYYFVKHVLMAYRRNAVVIATGGFVSAPVVFAAKALKIPVYLINVDTVPGKANRLLARYAKKIFVQFEQSKEYSPNRQVEIVGCPLRSDFQNPDRHKAFSDLALEEDKKVLLVTGASSGAANINDAMLSILSELSNFSDDWQIVHLTGMLHIDEVKRAIEGLDITYHAVDYYDDMPSLLAAADIVVGRAGAVSVAEFAAVGVPAVCLPYPYHKDNHQYKNAQVLVDAGAAIIVDDNVDSPTQTANDLLAVLKDLMANESKRQTMATAAKNIGTTTAADQIAKMID
ncbi:MAG: undecaprenyldiphospho-muramoylpentapeptide beta-N-acetylglucosaminyltransferase [Planctomycetales bacterium 4572_13]|nr:MAG: undecaprenyldiphospho-muramoylpentapeptide beta-N-acetylglucosaminyltransferase [Planctomycetales bacterium 4572_13]